MMQSAAQSFDVPVPFLLVSAAICCESPGAGQKAALARQTTKRMAAATLRRGYFCKQAGEGCGCKPFFGILFCDLVLGLSACCPAFVAPGPLPVCLQMNAD